MEVLESATEDVLKELRIESEELATNLQKSLEDAKILQEKCLEALLENLDQPSDLPDLSLGTPKIKALASELNKRADELKRDVGKSAIDGLKIELQELKTREIFGKHEKEVLEEINRKAKLAAYELCIRDTRTGTITRKARRLLRKLSPNG